MRALLLLGMILGMSLGLVSSAAAEQRGFPAQASIQEGEVNQVDTANNRVAIDSGIFRPAKHFEITQETQILRNGQEVALGSLKKGDSVLISYEEQDGRMIGKRIVVQDS